MNTERVSEFMWQAMPEGREKYHAYLCSREWAVVKDAVLERSGGVCERCGTGLVENVHHLTYARKYHEDLDDLAGWCRECHEHRHNKSDFDPLAARRRQLLLPRTFGVSLCECERNLTVDATSRLRCPLCGCCDVHLGCSFCGEAGVVVVPAWCEASHAWLIQLQDHGRGYATACTIEHDNWSDGWARKYKPHEANHV